MKLSIILLTWNSEKHVIKCIDSIQNNIGTNDYEIIVVDNGSLDNTKKIISMRYPTVKIVQNEINRGVAPARNQGIQAANSDYILILDIDTYVHRNGIDRMLNYMDKNPDVGLCGPKLCFDDGTTQHSFRRFPVIQTKILRRINTTWAKRLLKNEYYSAEMADVVNRGNEALEVDYVIGACQMIRRSALDEVGLLDDRIFYGPEDVDFCLRMWLKGWKVVYLPDATVTHYEQRITKKKIFSYITLKHIQGLVHYFIKYGYLFSRQSLYRRINRIK